MTLFIVLIVMTAASINLIDSANILSIIIFPSYSHQQPLLAVSTELARHGHNMTVITTDPPKEYIPNFNVIDTSSAYDFVAEYQKKSDFSFQKVWNSFSYITVVPECIEVVSDYLLSLPQIQQFIRDAKKSDYDLVIMEEVLFLSFGGIVHKVGSPPVVGIQTFSPWGPTLSSMGVPVNPSFMPDQYLSVTDRMDFLQRLHNTAFYWWTIYLLRTSFLPRQEKVLRKYFGDEPASCEAFWHSKILLLVSNDLSVAHPQPTLPNVILTGPLHLKKPNPLTKDLEKWFEGAEDGMVYFSLGSNMKGTSLEEEKRRAFVEAFKRFPKVRFLWKWESDFKIQGLSGNVLTRKWFPQQDIIGHRKLRLLIYQGGLQSTQECIYHGVPVLAIPLFGDQKNVVAKLEMEGAGLKLELNEINTESLYKALKELLYNERYKQNAMRLSRISKDRPATPLDTAVWWIEYVIRHKGAGHMRVSSLDLSWYQYNLIDVYAFVTAVIAIVAYVFYVVTKLCFKTMVCKKEKIKRK